MTYSNRTNIDWKFSNTVHESALSNIYEQIAQFSHVVKATKHDDLENGIDYWIYNKLNESYSIQERFRTSNKYTENSLEFTLRYERLNSHSKNQKKSEFFKIKAEYLLYGISDSPDTKKENFLPSFKRFVIIDLKLLFNEINNGNILIDENKNNEHNFPYKNKENKVFAIIKNNHEDKHGNSSLVIFNALDLFYLNPNIIVESFNYNIPIKINNSTDLNKSIEVVNFYKIGKQIPEDGVYIGRFNKNFNLQGSKFANPFPMKDSSLEERNRVVDEYKIWLWKSIANGSITKNDLLTLEGKKLVCYCAKLRCHGDILKETVELLINNENEFDNIVNKLKIKFKNKH